MGYSTLFQDQNLRAVSFGEGAQLMVTFDHWMKDRAGLPPVVVTDTFTKRGFVQLHISSARNDWYLNPSLPEMLRAVGGFSRGFERRAGVAFSMGGYGLLLASRAVTFDQVLFISPQTTFAPELPHDAPLGDDRFTPDLIDPGFARRAYAAQRDAPVQEADCAIAYDPAIAVDRAHAMEIGRNFRAARYLELPGSGHPATRHLPFQAIARAISRPVLREGIILRAQARFEQAS